MKWKNNFTWEISNFLEINLQFHEIIYKATRSSQLQDLLFQYYNLSKQYRSLGLELPGRYDQICVEHRNIANALLKGDRDKAEYYAREHRLIQQNKSQNL